MAMTTRIYTTVVLLIAIIVVVNLLSAEYHVRLDLTEDRQYTLSPATKDILNDLTEPVTVRAFFSKDLPPNIRKTRDDFQNLLIEYAALSDGQVLYEFVDPNEKESAEQDAISNGIQPVLIDIREKDQVKQQRAFLGATVSLGDRKEVIPFIQPGAAMEYALSTAIKKISIDRKPAVGFVTGHGEASLSEMMEVREQLEILYEPKEVQLSDSAGVPADITTLVMIRPMDSIPPADLETLDRFLGRGGRLLVALNRVHGDFRSYYGTGVTTGLEDWLRQKGVEVSENFVIDAQCGSVSMPQQFGAFTVQAHISFPYVPVISTFANHPATSGIESVMLEFASEVRPSGADSTLRFSPLAYSSELSAALPAPQFFDIRKQWTEDDFTAKNIVVAAAVEGNLSGNIPSRMLVIGDGDFPVNGPPQQARRLQADNASFLVNAIDWLSDDTGLIELRTKGVISRPIRQLDDSTKTWLKYLNFLLPLVLAVLYGVIRGHINNRKRIARMSENYQI